MQSNYCVSSHMQYTSWSLTSLAVCFDRTIIGASIGVAKGASKNISPLPLIHLLDILGQSILDKQLRQPIKYRSYAHHMT